MRPMWKTAGRQVAQNPTHQIWARKNEVKILQTIGLSAREVRVKMSRAAKGIF